jgi:hypothetical protein
MKALLVVVVVLAAAGGAAWLLLRPPEDQESTGGMTTERAATQESRGVDSDLRAVAPRLGVLGPRDRDLVADPDAPAWHTNVLRFSAAPGSRLTGLLLLNAIGEHLYVRAKDLDTLNQLKKEDLGMEVPPEMPMGVVITLLERAGYAVHVHEPRFVVRKMSPEEREQRSSPTPVPVPEDSGMR